MRILVVGNGGREHALTWKLKQSPHCKEIFCATGNGGMASLGSCVPIQPENTLELANFAKDMGVGLTVVGPELPLSLGIVDVFKKMGLRVFGPKAEAAKLESSKIFAKLFMERYNIPTAPFKVCGSFQEAEAVLKRAELGYPVVLKADGLAAGKGVLICKDKKEAIEGARQLMLEKNFGPAGDRIIIEKCLSGPEVSFMVICDGKRFLPLFPSCDYKRAFDNDEGPNTGGMGAYSPSVMVDRELYLKILDTIVEPTIQGMSEDGRPFSGLLYCGLMLTEDGPSVLEYNCRFGDPETQVILPLLKNDLLEIMHSVADGSLCNVESCAPDGHAVTVVMAADGYPGSYSKGMEISGIQEAEAIDGVTVFHAGTRLEEGRLLTSGGRVLNVTATAPQLEQAIFHAYKAVDRIKFDGARVRTDIAHKAIVGNGK